MFRKINKISMKGLTLQLSGVQDEEVEFWKEFHQ